MTHPHPRRAAFSLVELLVVVSILAVLAALSLPAMTKALGVAAEAQCVSNLRQLGQAYTAYTIDFKRKFPAGLRSGNREDVWYANLAGAQSPGEGDPRNTPAERRVLHRYLDGNAEVAVCPLDRGVVDYPNFRTVAGRWGSSYTMVNSERNRFGPYVQRNGVWSLEGFGLLDVSSPATKSVMTDWIQLRTLSAGEQNAWHGSKDGHLRSSMAFVDGHAEVVRLKVEPRTPTQTVDGTTRAAVEAMAKRDPYY